MNLPVLHLEEGLHHHSDKIKSGTLHFYRDEIYPEDIQVEVHLNKFEKNISCKITLNSRAHYRCDRCLRNFTRKYKDNLEILFHLGDREFEIDEENVIILPLETKEIDLLPYIQEMLILSIPMKLLCNEKCKGICAGCGADLNTELCKCPEKPADPRWEKLLSLKK